MSKQVQKRMNKPIYAPLPTNQTTGMTEGVVLDNSGNMYSPRNAYPSYQPAPQVSFYP